MVEHQPSPATEPTANARRRRVEAPATSPTWSRWASGFTFPEAPRWHAGALWLSDIHGHRVCRVTEDGHVETVARLDDRPSGLGFLPDGTPLVVSMLDRRLLVLVDGTYRVHADLGHLCRGFLNDMVVDRRGHAFVGARNPDRGAGHDAVLVVHPDGRAEVAAPSMHAPNGAALLDDGQTLVVAETSRARLTAFDHHDDGTLSNRRTWAVVPGTHPDGICADIDGGVWFGSPPTEEFVRVVADGTVTDRLPTVGRWAVACALGGPDRHTLFAITGRNSIDNLVRVGVDRTRDRDSDAEGWVETTRVPVAGPDDP